MVPVSVIEMFAFAVGLVLIVFLFYAMLFPEKL